MSPMIRLVTWRTPVTAGALLVFAAAAAWGDPPEGGVVRRRAASEFSLTNTAGVSPQIVSAGTYTSITDTTQNAPGQNMVFSDFFPPAISGRNLAFFATVNTTARGIYTGVAGSSGAVRIADTSTTPPGQGGAFSAFDYPAISGSTVAFRGLFDSNNGYGIYTGVAGTTGATRIADTSMTAPGQSAAFLSLGNPAISGSNVTFLGQFGPSNAQGIYTGVAGTTGATRMVDTSMTAPGQTTVFDSFLSPAISGSNVAFSGFFNDNSTGQGVYTGVAGTAGATRIADSTMTAPGQTTGFCGFGSPGISGGNVAFFGEFNLFYDEGMYTGVAGTTGATRIVDTSMTAPGQTTTFSGFLISPPPGISGSNVAFVGLFNKNKGQGIYTGVAGTTGATCIADTSMTVPGQTTTFTEFGPPLISGSTVAFTGYYNNGYGIFLSAGGALLDVAETGETLFGGTISSLGLINSGSGLDDPPGSDYLAVPTVELDGNTLTFVYTLTNGVSGVATVIIPSVPPTPFFAGEVALDNGVYYLGFPSGNPFGYYSFLSDAHYLYHFDLGYEYVFDAQDGKAGVYLYDFKSNDFFYTSPTFPFPYLYDFSLNTVLYYYPDPNNAGRYNTNGFRFFYRFDTGQIIVK